MRTATVIQMPHCVRPAAVDVRTCMRFVCPVCACSLSFCQRRLEAGSCKRSTSSSVCSMDPGRAYESGIHTDTYTLSPFRMLNVTSMAVHISSMGYALAAENSHKTLYYNSLSVACDPVVTCIYTASAPQGPKSEEAAGILQRIAVARGPACRGVASRVEPHRMRFAHT